MQESSWTAEVQSECPRKAGSFGQCQLSPRVKSTRAMEKALSSFVSSRSLPSRSRCCVAEASSSPSPSSDGWRRSARPPRGPGGCAAAASWCGCTGWATAAAPTSSSPTISPRPPSATPAGPSPPRPPPPSRATVGACHHASSCTPFAPRRCC